MDLNSNSGWHLSLIAIKVLLVAGCYGPLHAKDLKMIAQLQHFSQKQSLRVYELQFILCKSNFKLF